MKLGSLKSLIIARYTFMEMLKSKMLWNVGVLGLFIAVCTYVAAEFTYGVPVRVAVDLGLGSLTLSSYMISLLIGLNLVSKETDSRTIYLIISRPVGRTSFLVGKILGLIFFLMLNIFLLSLVTISVVLSLGGEISSLLLAAMFFSMLESILLLCLVVLISLLVNQAITLIFSLIMLTAGHAIGETVNASFVLNRPWLKQILDILDLILPGFYRFNLKDFVLYQPSISSLHLLSIVLYCLFYSAALIFCSAWVLNRKNLD
jgi:ABC-type transport system involved in multi-copper enzyme maturation permease subunit